MKNRSVDSHTAPSRYEDSKARSDTLQLTLSVCSMSDVSTTWLSAWLAVSATAAAASSSSSSSELSASSHSLLLRAPTLYSHSPLDQSWFRGPWYSSPHADASHFHVSHFQLPHTIFFSGRTIITLLHFKKEYTCNRCSVLIFVFFILYFLSYFLRNWCSCRIDDDRKINYWFFMTTCTWHDRVY